jgi:DNA-directed RNA polymerase subunit RPC12/RpoP
MKNTKTVTAICPRCGGPVEVNTQEANAICEYCGSQIIVGKLKISAVESVLNFVKDQQKRIDDMKKEKKEEERKAREEAEKSFKKYGWIYLLVLD